jgi:hypothetical protein
VLGRWGKAVRLLLLLLLWVVGLPIWLMVRVRCAFVWLLIWVRVLLLIVWWDMMGCAWSSKDVLVRSMAFVGLAGTDWPVHYDAGDCERNVE